MSIAIRLITLALIVYSIKLLPTLKHEYLVIIILFYSHKKSVYGWIQEIYEYDSTTFETFSSRLHKVEGVTTYSEYDIYPWFEFGQVHPVISCQIEHWSVLHHL